MQKQKIFFRLILLGLIAGLGMYGYARYQRERAVPSPVLSIAPTSPTPTPVAQISPDGTHTVELKTVGDKTEILVNGQLIVTRLGNSGGELRVPFNTWSPDDKYFFLEEKKAEGEEYLVMKASGETFTSGEQSLTVGKLFRERYPENTIVSVTGWASPTLLIINASSEKEASMSYWFEVPSQKFIRLATYFY